MWIADQHGDSVTEINVSDGSLVQNPVVAFAASTPWRCALTTRASPYRAFLAGLPRRRCGRSRCTIRWHGSFRCVRPVPINDGLEQRQVRAGEKVESGVGPSAIVDVLAELVEILESRARFVATIGLPGLPARQGRPRYAAPAMIERIESPAPERLGGWGARGGRTARGGQERG